MSSLKREGEQGRDKHDDEHHHERNKEWPMFHVTQDSVLIPLSASGGSRRLANVPSDGHPPASSDPSQNAGYPPASTA